jgi:hypothetical protein
MNLFWLVRMRRGLQHPPSPMKLAVVSGVVAFVLALAAVEHFIGWPEALSVDGQGLRRFWR